jgi:hypothetical protein
MKMICLRNIQFIDAESLSACEAREALFRDQTGFLLYLSKDIPFGTSEERVARLEAREALIWLNETEQDRGSFWV